MSILQVIIIAFLVWNAIATIVVFHLLSRDKLFDIKSGILYTVLLPGWINFCLAVFLFYIYGWLSEKLKKS